MDNNYMIFNSSRINAFTMVNNICKAGGFDETFSNELWTGLIESPVLYDEFVYYVEKGEFTGLSKCEGYVMSDLYFHHLREFNLYHDIGKNTSLCDKDMIAINAFHTMVMLKKEPEKYKKLLERSLGMDME